MGHNLSPNKTIEDKAHGMGISSPYLYSVIYAAAAGVKLADGISNHKLSYEAIKKIGLIKQEGDKVSLTSAGRSYLNTEFNKGVHPGTWVINHPKVNEANVPGMILKPV
jgi:hypothetical protein